MVSQILRTHLLAATSLLKDNKREFNFNVWYLNFKENNSSAKNVKQIFAHKIISIKFSLCFTWFCKNVQNCLLGDECQSWEMKKCADEGWAARSVKSISVLKPTLLRVNRWCVCVFQIMWYYVTWTVEFPAAFNQSVSPFKARMTSTPMTAPLVVPLQLYLCYDSFTHVISVYVNLNLEASSTCGTRVVSTASILVFCCTESRFTHIKCCQQSKDLQRSLLWPGYGN